MILHFDIWLFSSILSLADSQSVKLYKHMKPNIHININEQSSMWVYKYKSYPEYSSAQILIKISVINNARNIHIILTGTLIQSVCNSPTTLRLKLSWPFPAEFSAVTVYTAESSRVSLWMAMSVEPSVTSVWMTTWLVDWEWKGKVKALG